MVLEVIEPRLVLEQVLHFVPCLCGEVGGEIAVGQRPVQQGALREASARLPRALTAAS